MKIMRVEAFPVSLPLKKPFKIALGVMTHSPHAVVRLTTDEGIVGHGEASTWHVVYGYDQHALVWAIERYLGPAVMGMEVTDLESILLRMDAVLPKNLMAKAGIEIACQDARAKALGVPVSRVIGGMIRAPVEIIEGIDIVPLEEAEAMAARHVANGFRCLKVKVGLDLKEDVERVRLVRETVGPEVRIRVDGNQGYDRPSAFRFCQEMERLGLQWIEQPLPEWDLEGLAMLAEALWTPIAVDESIYTVHDVYRVAKARAADVINIKVSKCGGITSSLKIANAAASMGLPCFVGGCLETGVGTAAALHFGACAPNLFPAVELVGSSIFTDDIVKKPFAADRGTIPLPERPGIGVEVDEEKLKHYSGN
ncbi:MAG: enolase C-terminal domain-like protein [Thermodesulfobacteriota bacterium]